MRCATLTTYLARRSLEHWQVLSGFSYEVSDGGRVRRVGGERKLAQGTGYILKPNLNRFGYHQFILTDLSRARRNFLAHRLVWLVFRGPIKDGLEINHLNGIKTDNNLANLEVCTHSENLIHSWRVLGHQNGAPKGEKHYAARLTNGDVKTIREARGLSQKILARQFEIDPSTVSKIRSRKRWSSVT